MTSRGFNTTYTLYRVHQTKCTQDFGELYGQCFTYAINTDSL